MDEKREKSLIIVAGDWVIDEYWFLVRHHSRISSHTGFVHYRVESKPGEQIYDLCGAGHVARILATSRKSTRDFDLVGLGSWHGADTEEFLHLLHARDNKKCHANEALFHQRRPFCDHPPAVQLHSLNPEAHTIRVIRQYHRKRGGLKQISRIDWEQPSDKAPGNLLGPTKLPKNRKTVVIAINDLRKGVVTEEFVCCLMERYPGARWCVRTKDPRKAKPWIDRIAGALVVHVIGPEVAAKINPWDSWNINDHVTLQAMENLGRFSGENVFLLSHRHEVAARMRNDRCLIAQSQTKPSITSELGWSTAFFAALVEIAIGGESGLNKRGIINAVKRADQEAGLPTEKDRKVEEPIVNVSRWSTQYEEWKNARRNLGFVEGERPDRRPGDDSPPEKDRTLEVWRGSSLLPGYVACVGEKEKIIRRIGAQLRSFRRDSRRLRSLSILLQADPGAGKTFLAKSLARSFGFSFRSFDITQMLHRDDLLELFEDVATSQANEPDKDLLVFVDEINAQVDGAQVYSSFLTPLEEGYYVKRGRAFALRPCVWIFAGTDPERSGLSKSQKYSDFESRITLVEKLDFASLQRIYGEKEKKVLHSEARLEQVYLAAIMIHNIFPDVTLVSRRVLRHFHSLNPKESPSRRIRQMCEALRDVQYGKVSRRNCDEWGDVEWEDGEKEFIKLIF